MTKITLALDVGNTRAKCRPLGPQGAAGRAVSVTRHQVFTARDWSNWFRKACAAQDLAPEAVDRLVFASVVPPADPFIRQAAAGLGWEVLSVPGDLPVPLENRYARPQEVGADRLVVSLAARRLFPERERLVIVDFGTATTFDCVLGEAFLGGLICPGLLSSARSLHEETAKLPLPTLELSSEELHIGTSTMDSLNQGLLFGAAALVEGLCARLGGVLGGPPFVVATGGLAPKVARLCPAIQALVPDLLFEGLAFLTGHDRRHD